MRIHIDKMWRVNAWSEVILPVSARQAWGQMRDLPGFVSVDPLHTRVRFTDAGRGSDPMGRSVLIPHRLFGVGPDRVGRVLRWREGSGYDFSDLSRRGVRNGFPHVCSYYVRQRSEHSCALRISARGRWTATWMPRPLAVGWLWWVLRSTENCLESHFAAFAKSLRRRTG